MLPPKGLPAYSAARSPGHWGISRFIPRYRGRFTRGSVSASCAISCTSYCGVGLTVETSTGKIEKRYDTAALRIIAL
ncbi:hypothetical protein NDU88_003550 [Pleurodeles waltl]|uniref:Uncharacterized protein n=1 Tax=Pleurodeles waltl TaxID=8319 RepID=A0AAV7RH19_PLEWA|nr:hypothetical protein NDU88_003550 [Pleurodeles waltl]